jgi:DNA-binding MarR family transcriptional regulator
MSAPRSLATLLSQALVAFTIEFDNESGRRSAHRTTVARQAGEQGQGAWLVSLVMWANFMRFVGEQGRPLSELAEQARMTNLKGLVRWGYIVLEPDPADPHPAPPRGDWLVRTTRHGARAQEVWRPLAGEIEGRWRERFGARAIAALRGELEAVAGRLELELPHYLPVSGVHRQDPERWRARGGPGEAPASLDLSALLSQVLLAFTIDFERESPLSLALSANALRVIAADGVAVRDLPALTGLSREANAVALGFLERNALALVEDDPRAARTKVARLTERGDRAQGKYARLLRSVEGNWRVRFGAEAIDRLRASLAGLIDARAGDRSLMAEGLVPPPGGWRGRPPYLAQTSAMLADPGAALPHYPAVSHRGGFPDGS